MKRYLLFILLTIPLMARGQTMGYWFDDERPSDWQTASATGSKVHLEADVSHLPAGLHTLHTYYLGSDGRMSSPVSRHFVKTLGNTFSGRFWFDENTERKTIALSEGIFLVDVSHLSDGLHTFCFEATDSHGTATAPITGTFIKLTQLRAIDSLTCRCSVDGNFWREERVDNTNGLIRWNLDVSGLAQGFHNLTIELLLPNGQSAGTYNTWFLREPLRSETNDYVCMYNIDGDAEQQQAGSMSDGAWHFDLDVEKLSDGLHCLTYYLSNLKGVQTETHTAFFIKTPVGGTGMVSWQWWLNDLTDDIHTTTLQKPVDPLQVVQMLDVGHQPLRTLSFHFEAPAKRQPTIYAKNQLHLRFSDVSQRSTEQVWDFVDKTISEPVTDIAELLSQPSHAFGKHEEGHISWYQLPMTPGDSLLLWTNTDCRIEAFSPKGEVLYQVSSADSRKRGGFEAQDSMTCFVALHDQQGGGTLSYLYSKWINPQLSIEATTAMVHEGDSLSLIIRRNRMTHVTVELSLTASHPNLVALPAKVTIPAGQDSLVVGMCILENETYQAPYNLTITVSAPRHDEGRLVLQVSDNDLPMDLAEWQLLKSWYETQGGNVWKQPWTFGQTPEQTDSLPGVLMRNSHVLAVSLPDNNVSGPLQPHLFQLPYIETIDLERNAINGSVDEQLTTQIGQNTTLSSLNIAHNRIAGNVGLLCQALTALRQLDASYNCFATVVPMISPQVSTLDLSHQTISEVSHLHLGNLSTTEITSQLPNILFYQHAAQRYAENICWRMEEPAHNWTLTMAWNDGLLTTPYVSEQNTYYGAQGDTLLVRVVDDANHNKGDTFPLALDFDAGDANFNGDVDVVDLQAAINYFFDNYTRRPFIFTAANLDRHHDQTINVQDVVGMVNLLLDIDAENTSRQAKRRNAPHSRVYAQCYVDDGQIILESTIPVAAFDIVIEGKAKSVSMPDGMTVSRRSRGGNTHLVGYSLTGVTLPEGRTVIGRITSDEATVLSVKLADAEANEISVRTSDGVVTGIAEDVPSDDEEEKAVYNLGGQQLVNPGNENADPKLSPGLYIVDGKKMTIKKK